MPSDLGFVSNASEGHSDELPSHRPCDGFSQRGLPDTGRAHKAEDGALHVVLQLTDGKVFQDSLLDLLQVVVILFEHLRRFSYIQIVLGSLRPGKLENPVQVGAGNDVLGFLTGDELDSWKRTLESIRTGGEEARKWQWAYYERELEITGMMADMEVPILPGTDCPGPFLFPGFSLHDELEILVEAGLSEVLTLRAATYALGTVDVGKLADLVLLEGNPLDTISNTRRIAAVVADGRLFTREGLDSLFAEVRARAREAGGAGS